MIVFAFQNVMGKVLCACSNGMIYLSLSRHVFIVHTILVKFNRLYEQSCSCKLRVDKRIIKTVLVCTRFLQKRREAGAGGTIRGVSGGKHMWFVFALLSAVFAALTSILAKVGIDGVNSNLATAVRTVVVVIMAWGMVFLTHTQSGLSDISRKSWVFLILSGLATGASWLCYYRALQLGDASKVVPIDKLSVVITLVLAFVFLHEQFTAKSLIGCILIGVGTLVMVL